MVKATVICGSANEQGVTHRMCKSVSEGLSSAGYEVDMICPADLDIRHCTDCGGCDEGGCIIDDDMSRIYDSFSGSELLILATPIHFSGPSSILKTVMDRFQPYWGNKGMKHPEYCFALLCGGSKQPNFELTERIIRAFCITTGMDFRGSMNIPDTDSGVDDVAERTKEFLRGYLGFQSS